MSAGVSFMPFIVFWQALTWTPLLSASAMRCLTGESAFSMPEGPSIVILKDEAQSLVGRRIVAVEGNTRIDKERLVGHRIVALRSWGKHFLVELPTFALRVHFMFEHVGRARLPEYFAKIRRLLKPGGLLLNHGITAGGTRNHQLGSGLGDFIEKYIFPGGELEHVSHVLEHTADAGLEAVDVENLRPHYAKTLWA